MVAGLLLLDVFLANRETRELLRTVEASESAMVGANRRVEAAFGPYDASSMPPDQESTIAIIDALLRIGREESVAIQTAGAQVEDVNLLPWHRDLRRARDSYLDHVEAWRRYLDALAEDPTAMTNPEHSTEIRATFLIAGQRFEKAVPWRDLYDSGERIDQVFSDG